MMFTALGTFAIVVGGPLASWALGHIASKIASDALSIALKHRAQKRDEYNQHLVSQFLAQNAQQVRQPEKSQTATPLAEDAVFVPPRPV